LQFAICNLIDKGINNFSTTNSFGIATNRPIFEELQESDLDVEIRDIYTLYPNYTIDVEEEQEILIKNQATVL